jgi:hypothetical protein
MEQLMNKDRDGSFFREIFFDFYSFSFFIARTIEFRAIVIKPVDFKSFPANHS